MMDSKKLTRLGKRKIKDEMLHRGFVENVKGQFSIALEPSFEAWVGFMFASGVVDSRRARMINPLVGLRDLEIEALVCRIRGDNFDRKKGPMHIGGNIGYIMPENTYLEWPVYDEDTVAPSVENMMAAIEEYAIPFFRRCSDREVIAEMLLENKRCFPSVREYRCPVYLYALGRTEEAFGYIDKTLKDIAKKAKTYDNLSKTYEYLDWFREQFLSFVEQNPDPSKVLEVPR